MSRGQSAIDGPRAAGPRPLVTARTGAHVAWLSAIGFESAFIMFGLIRFFSTRYLGGTLFGLITMGVLLHPAVARAFSGAQGQGERAFAAEHALSDADADAPG